MPRLHTAEKWRIVYTMERTNNLAKTARMLGYAVDVVRRWWRRFETTGNVTANASSGRKPALSSEVATYALDMLLRKGSKGANHVAMTLHKQGLTKVPVHKSTIIRHASRAADATGIKLRVRRGKPPKGLTKATLDKRLNFAKSNKTRNWSCVLFSDRKKFHFAYPGSKVQCVQWVNGDNKHNSEAVWQPNHPQCVNVYAAITRFGVTDVHVVAGTSKHSSPHTTKQGKPAKNITSSEYKEVLKVTLLPGGKKLFSAQGMSTWYLQQDNDPTHKCAKAEIQAWNHSKGSSVQLLEDWPPNSPDLNIIENVWAYVQAKVNAMGCHTFEEFKDAVISEIKAVPKGYIAKLYQSLPKRMAAVIEMEGEKTKY